jgi:tetratricopeptide (TPR) repeat protein
MTIKSLSKVNMDLVEVCITASLAAFQKSPRPSAAKCRAAVDKLNRGGDDATAVEFGGAALRIARQSFGNRDPKTLTSINNLAFLYQAQNRYAEAEPLYREALQASREVLGVRHPDTLNSLVNIAEFYRAQGRFDEAEPFLRDAAQMTRESDQSAW